MTSIWFSIRGFTEPGDQVLVFTPVYDPFFVAIRTQERKEVDCPRKTLEEGMEKLVQFVSDWRKGV